ncbi:MAG: sarcosine oxidase subunit gamma [Novosphingobium sp.]|uniref:sarcosine oxidase subunit gamma n=1 Tax=Novosphingobium sp. TaxID=1874826 RepID=UPI003B9C4A7B
MADLIVSGSPLPAEAARYEGVTISPAAALRRYSLRARDAVVLSGLIGRALPERIGQELGGVIQLGPDEYYAVLGEGESLPLGEGQMASVVDVSSRAVGIVVEGPRAAETIMAGCPLDMDHFAVGRATRTLFETVEIVLRRESETRFHVEVWRSFAPWLWQALCEAAHG